jgi:hypothetical protein
MPLLRSTSLALLALALASCGPTRVEIEPGSVVLHARGQRAALRATPVGKGGRAMPEQVCRWSSSNEAVARVESARNNEAAVVAAGHGDARVRCAAGSASAEVPVAVRLVARVSVSPAALELTLRDEPAPAALSVHALDGEGREMAGRPVLARCLDEDVCRGDHRGQVWPVAPGATRVEVAVDDGRAEADVRVVDGRTTAGKPKAVRGNPMEHLGDGLGR